MIPIFYRKNRRLGASACLAAAMIAVLLAFGCGKKDEFAGTNTAGENAGGIILNSNTALRIDPYLFSGCIARLDKGVAVEIFERSSEKSLAEGASDYWYHVKLKQGVTGWLYGKNIKIVSASSREKLDEMVSEFREQETGEIQKEISGKWWSINRFGDFTTHCLELYPDGKYKSYAKGQEDKPMEGTWSLDVVRNEVTFKGETSFRRDLKFVQRGQSFSLFTPLDDDELRFKKILNKIDETAKAEDKGNDKKEAKPEGSPEKAPVNKTDSKTENENKNQ
jgi:hypothetical protein